MTQVLGKTIIDVVLDLPNQNWIFQDGGRVFSPQLKTLIFVYYENLTYTGKKPRTSEDTFRHVQVHQGFSLADIPFLQKEERRCIGLISKVAIKLPYRDGTYRDLAHIPMLDFDTSPHFDYLDEQKLLGIIINAVINTTEIQEGVILQSSPRHYHFMGTKRLLSEQELITFLGLALTMKHTFPDGREVNLADARHIGHSLTPLEHFADFNKCSSYDFTERFTTLRLTPRRPGEDYPRVVGILI